MRYIKSRNQINENFSNDKLEDLYARVMSILDKKIETFSEHGSDFKVNMGGDKLIGKLFRAISGRAIRFNWYKNSETSIIHSVSLWKNLEIDRDYNLSNPDKIIYLNGESITKAVKIILGYFSGNVSESLAIENAEQEESEPFSLDSISDLDSIDDFNIGIFAILQYRVSQLALGTGTSLNITGMSGMGKTFDTKDVLNQIKAPYKFYKGDISTAGLYSLLFRYRDSLIVFDDMDSVFKDENNVNMLKAALDSDDDRIVSRPLTTYFKTDGMTMNDIIANHTGDEFLSDNKHLFNIKNKGKMPESFSFSGKIIFISNLPYADFPDALKTRSSANVDIQLTHDEVMERMRSVMKSIAPNVPMDKKERVLQFIDFLHTNYETNEGISIRGLLNAIDTMSSNDRLIEINGKKVFAWQILIKNDMIGKNAKRRK